MQLLQKLNNEKSENAQIVVIQSNNTNLTHNYNLL